MYRGTYRGGADSITFNDVSLKTSSLFKEAKDTGEVNCGFSSEILGDHF